MVKTTIRDKEDDDDNYDDDDVDGDDRNADSNCLMCGAL